MSSSQQAAIKRLESLFRDVQVSHPHVVSIQRRMDKSCCDIHGRSNSYKENCANNRSLSGSKVSLGTILSSSGRTSPASIITTSRRNYSPPKKEIHPSSFPNTLRRNQLNSSSSSNNKYSSSTLPRHNRDFRSPSPNSQQLKDTATAYNSPLRRDYVAKSMTSLSRPLTPSRSDSPVRATSSFLTDTATIRTNLSQNLSNNKSTPNILKSCLAGSNVGHHKSNLSLRIQESPVSFGDKVPSVTRRSYERRRLFSSDSLENLKRNSWDPSRRGSSGSSGGWDDAIWEEDYLGGGEVIFVFVVF